jgi:hypothetical protein
VARSLERDWPEKLTALDQRARDDAERRPAASSQGSEAERQGILALVHDLPAVWHAKTTTHAARTHVVRLRMKAVMLTQLAQTGRVEVRWQTHAWSTLEVPRPQPADVGRRTTPEVLERIAQWCRDHPDIGIAECRNHAGYRSGQGGAFTASKGNWLRSAYGIQRGCPVGPAACPSGQRGDGHSSAQAAAALLNGTVDTSAEWGKAGTLDGVHVAPRGPWGVKLTPEGIAALRKPVRQYKPRRAQPAVATTKGRVARQSRQRSCRLSRQRPSWAAPRSPHDSWRGWGGRGGPTCGWAARHWRKAWRMISLRLALRPRRVSRASRERSRASRRATGPRMANTQVGSSRCGRPLAIVDSMFYRSFRDMGLKQVVASVYFIQKIFIVNINCRR